VLEFARTASAIGATTSTLEKARLLAGYLAGLDDEDLRRAANWFSGLAYGRAERKTLNLGWAAIGRAVDSLSTYEPEQLSALFLKHSDLGDWAGEALVGASASLPLSLAEVARAFEEIRTAKGVAPKQQRLRELLGALDPEAARYVVKVLAAEMRIGLQEGIVEAAVARAFEAPLEAVKRVHMLTGDIGETAVRVRHGRLAETQVELFQPIRFMLASAVETPAEAMQRAPSETVWTEEKYDGVRCQLHRAGDRVELFSRDLKETTAAFPEIAEAALQLPHDLLLDGEILAHSGDQVLPFHDLQKRLGRKVVSAALRRDVPLVLVAFDLLWADGEALLELPLSERRARLEGLGLQHPFLLARVESAASEDDLERIFAETRERGNEGLMLKDPGSAYSPGRRGMAWLKLKRPLATLDCVVTAVEWGHGKRRGVLSDYTFAVRDQEQGGRLVNVGKAYTGLTDAEIATMTRHFLDHTVADHGRVRLVEPDTVVEIAFDAIQRSARHRSGFALRFPRIVRLREDKPPAEADTLDRVRQLYDRYFGRTTPLAAVAEVEKTPPRLAGRSRPQGGGAD
jgi:DNA ligase-1